jgi:hypothetical protein
MEEQGYDSSLCQNLPSRSERGRWVILDLFKYAEEVNDKVNAVYGKPNTDKAGKSELIVAYLVA